MTVENIKTDSPNGSIGNYATIKTRPWLSAIKTNKKTKENGTKGSVIYPIFELCAEKTKDPFWISIFNQAANGKFPRGFMFKDNALTYKKGTKIQRLDIAADPEIAMRDIMEFLTKTAGIMSEIDQDKAKEEMEARIAENGLSLYRCQWSEIKKKIKNLLIDTYIQDLVLRYELNDKERIQLKSTINLGFVLGYFQNNDIDFQNGRIQSINNLEYNEESRKFNINKNCVPRLSKTKSKKTNLEDPNSIIDPTIISFMTLWKRFLNNIDKRNHFRSPSVSLSSETDILPPTDISTDHSTQITNVSIGTSYITSNE